MSLIKKTCYLEREITSLIVEGRVLSENVETLIIGYTPCLSNINIRPTCPINRGGNNGERLFERYGNVIIKPEERLKIIKNLFCDLDKKLVNYKTRVGSEIYNIIFDDNNPLERIRNLHRQFSSICEKDIVMWKTENLDCGEDIKAKNTV